MDIQEIMPWEKGYPPLLGQSIYPPKKLYFYGDISIVSGRCVSVVGSRKTTGYGRWAAERTGRKLAEHGITVVSGMAAGIDSCSHKGALAASGKTVAVLGCGIDICYPASNKELKEAIGKNGLLLSEYPPGYPAAPYTFPMRNRIISGISEATVVISAGVRSGALITAELASEQGRDVYVVPGDINNIHNLGSNKLLRDGAIPLAVIDDLLDDLGVERKESKEIMASLGKDEKKIFAVIEEGESTVDMICRRLKASPSQVNGIITVLEMKGVINTAMGKVFVAK